MKTWKITYTENCGETYQVITVSGKDYTEAYVNAMCKISKEAEITEVKEIV